MVITIDPNYELFLNMVILYWLIIGILNLFVGIFRADKNIRTKYGWPETLAGVLFVGMVILVFVC